jgi:glutamine amidotransferase-like uncharacterized protein
VPSEAQVEYTDLTGVNVAIYNGLGVMGSSRMALTRLFEWMNATVVAITASQIINESLCDYDILVIPGGSETTASSELESEGKQKIIDFIAQGGSYFGICGGATFGVTYLRLFDGYIVPGSEEGDLIHATMMHVNQSSAGPDLSDLPVDFTTMYYASQYFVPKQGTSFYTVATYDYNDNPGMIAFEYGNGTVFLSSPHPEFEENGDRDETTFGDDLDDPDSEWDLLLRVSTWLVEASYVEPTDSTPPPLDLSLIVMVSGGVVVVAIAVVALYRRSITG